MEIRHSRVRVRTRLVDINHLQARDAELFRRQMLLDGAFRVLAAVGRQPPLLHNLSVQARRARVERMALKPERLKERLDRIANAAPSDASKELRILVEDTKPIVRRRCRPLT